MGDFSDRAEEVVGFICLVLGFVFLAVALFGMGVLVSEVIWPPKQIILTADDWRCVSQEQVWSGKTYSSECVEYIRKY